ncbi:MAG TPA: inorganic phosphate transporter [Bacteroidetes bacterium]|nr:inorganic phosphate transporter [Bacteroidota bacterium]
MTFWPISSGIFLGWSLGSNDAANIFGTGVATNMIKFRTAVTLIAVFVVAGALLEGTKVMSTVGELSDLTPVTAFYCTLSAGILVAVMSKYGVPVSTSQAIIGAILGAGLLNNSADFHKLTKIVLCWVLTPVGGIIFSILFYRILAALFRSKIMSIYFRAGILKLGIILAGSYGAYALGSNNVANVTGVYVGAGMLHPFAAALIGSLSISLGVITYSKNVMYTVGKQIFPLDDFSAFIVVISQATTVHIFTQIGVPVSASQAVVGAVVGIGLLNNVRAVQSGQLLTILAGWILTPIGTALITMGLVSIF